MVVQYRNLCGQEIHRALFCEFIRHQIVKKCLRRKDDGWKVEEVPFVDDWSEEEYHFLVQCLKNTAAAGGFVYAAFFGSALKGFVSVEPVLFGGENQYLDLSSLHVSEDMRRNGIGKALFLAAKRWARDHGAKKLYISAHSAVESQAFYKAMGCVDAKEYNWKHIEKEPYDRQMECSVDG